MEEATLHQKSAKRFGAPPASTGGYPPNRPKAGHELTFKVDQSKGAIKITPYFPTKLRC